LATRNRASTPRLPSARTRAAEKAPANGKHTVNEEIAAIATKYLETSKQLVDLHLEKFLPSKKASPGKLHEAMRYSTFAGGKRLRPALVFAADCFRGGAREDAAPSACAVEMIHTYSLIHDDLPYSLIHDDLPAMDDDDLRRGMPTNHKVFGEAIAILAGDGLLTFAFEVLTHSKRVEAIPGIVRAIAQGAGTQGMVGGQVLDIENEGKPFTLDSVRAIHAWKTAALITSCCQAGALAGGATQTEYEHLTVYGQKIGLAFQIVDDILDITSSPEALGKTPGKDERSGKATYPAVLGLDKARQEADRLAAQAFDSLKVLGPRARTLEALGRFVVERQS
jgi:geranylgeranyl diphosphate synthase, type II